MAHEHQYGNTQQATSIRLTTCNNCGTLEIWLLDEYDNAFAVAVIDEDAALNLVEIVVENLGDKDDMETNH